MKELKVKDIKTCLLDWRQIPGDVLERIAGYETFIDVDEYSDYPEQMKIYNTKRLKNILTNPNDDTNDNTKYRIEKIYEQIKDYEYFIIEYPENY